MMSFNHERVSVEPVESNCQVMHRHHKNGIQKSRQLRISQLSSHQWYSGCPTLVPTAKSFTLTVIYINCSSGAIVIYINRNIPDGWNS